MNRPDHAEFRRALRARKILRGLFVSLPNVDVLELIAKDWQWLWIDAQHSPIDANTALSLVRAAEALDVPALIRVAALDEREIGQALDHGAAGVIVPMVNTVEQARQAVSWARFPPRGRRSVGSRRLMSLDGRSYWVDDQRISVVAQLETSEAIANATDIANVSGIDAVFLGTDDLAAEAGDEIEFPVDPAIRDRALTQVAERLQGTDTALGCFCDNPESLRSALALGATFLICAEDWLLLKEASKKAAAQYLRLIG